MSQDEDAIVLSMLDCRFSIGPKVEDAGVIATCRLGVGGLVTCKAQVSTTSKRMEHADRLMLDACTIASNSLFAY